MNIETVKSDILREAGKHGNQVYRLRNVDGDFVKVRRGYSHPEVRAAYIEALDGLIADGLLDQVFSNKTLELFRVVKQGGGVTTRQMAREMMLIELGQSGRIYKIHSDAGEFLQCGNSSYDAVDEERILFLEALHHLVYHDNVRIVSETREMTTYAPALPSDTGFVQYMH